MESNQNLLSSELQIDTTGHAHLAETTKWATFLSILGFIGSALLVIAALFAATALGNLSSAYGGSAVMSGGTIMIVYLVIAVVYFFMSLYLYKFASKMKTALYSNDQDSLNTALLNLKNLYKLMGIIAIIYLALCVLGIIFVMIAGGMRY